VGDLYMGQVQKATVVYDTGSSYLTVTSTECDATCKSRAYDRTQSPNSKLLDGNIKTLTVLKTSFNNIYSMDLQHCREKSTQITFASLQVNAA